MQGVNPWIEVDGGVSPANAYQLIEVGANALVAGSAVFGAKDYAEGWFCPLTALAASICLICVSPMCAASTLSLPSVYGVGS